MSDPATLTLDPAARAVLASLAAEERLHNLRRINLLRLGGVSVFLALFTLQGTILNRATWQSHLGLLATYLALAAAVAAAARESPRLARLSGLAIALVDMPMVFLLQRSTFAQSQPSGVAGFTLGIFVLLLALTTVALDRREVILAAAMGAGLEGTLQRVAGVDAGGIAAAALLLAFTAVGCLYAQRRLLGLLERAVLDLRERAVIQKRMADNDRLASIGTLAASVAHDVNNPMSYVINNLELVGEMTEQLAGQASLRAEDVADLRQAVSSALEGSDQVTRLVRDLTTLSRAGSGELHPVSLEKVVASAVNVARHQIQRRARLVTNFRSVPLISGDESRLGQVFVNLLVNAAQAIPEGASADHTVTVETFTDSVGRAVAVVSDTGAGIPEALRRRIFEPFFTTKPVGQGTGLGLSICREIVTGHGGDIAVESVDGRGTRFQVTIPTSAGN